MELQDFFILWQDIGLFLYSVLKAFLPLPSLEAVLTPLCLHSPQKWLLYSLEGALGTCVGGAIGYAIAYRLGKKALAHLVSREELQKGEQLIRRHGVFAVFIGGITPIPDFLLAYLAGFARMNLIAFLLCDGFARLVRSLLVTYGLKTLGTALPLDDFGIWLSFLIMLWLVWKWWKQKRKSGA